MTAEIIAIIVAAVGVFIAFIVCCGGIIAFVWYEFARMDTKRTKTAAEIYKRIQAVQDIVREIEVDKIGPINSQLAVLEKAVLPNPAHDVTPDH